MINRRMGIASVLAGAAALAIAGGGTMAVADRGHPEDGPHHQGPANAALKHFDGTVLSKHQDPRSFEIRTESGQKRKFRVNGKTQFERIPGFGGLHRGLKVQVNAKSTDRGLVARKVETSGGGGGGSGGGDDGPNHT